MGSKFRLLSFALYDSGETILGALIFSTLYPLYITQFVDVKAYSVLYGSAFLMSFFFALQLGRVADSRGLRKVFFSLSNLLMMPLFFILFFSFSRPELNLLFYLLLAVIHQQALVFYNSLLLSFENRGVASGFGVALGYVASAVALVILAPRLSMPYAFLWVALVFFLLSAPSMLFLREPAQKESVRLMDLLRDRTFLMTLLSMLMLMELAHTLIAMMSVYLREVYGLKPVEIYRVIGSSAIGGVLGGLIFGKLTDRISARVLFPFGFLFWSLFIIFLYLAPKSFILPAGFLAGLSLAHLWTSSRVLLIERFEGGQVAVRFAFYSLSERIASSVGLFVWSFYLYLTGDNYRLSALLMLAFPAVGFILYRLSDRRL